MSDINKKARSECRIANDAIYCEIQRKTARPILDVLMSFDRKILLSRSEGTDFLIRPPIRGHQLRCKAMFLECFSIYLRLIF